MQRAARSITCNLPHATCNGHHATVRAPRHAWCAPHAATGVTSSARPKSSPTCSSAVSGPRLSACTQPCGVQHTAAVLHTTQTAHRKKIELLQRSARTEQECPTCHFCTGTGPGLTTAAPGLGLGQPTTSAPGLGLPFAAGPGSRLRTSAPGLGLPPLHRDRARPRHICTGTARGPATSAPGLGAPAPRGGGRCHRTARTRPYGWADGCQCKYSQ